MHDYRDYHYYYRYYYHYFYCSKLQSGDGKREGEEQSPPLVTPV